MISQTCAWRYMNLTLGIRFRLAALKRFCLQHRQWFWAESASFLMISVGVFRGDWTVVSLLTSICSEVKSALMFLQGFCQPVHCRWYSYGLLAGWYDVGFPAVAKELLFTKIVLATTGTVPPACLLDTRFIPPPVKMIGAWSWPLSSLQCWG